jgi:speckle-type POZ protein
MGTGRYA